MSVEKNDLHTSIKVNVYSLIIFVGLHAKCKIVIFLLFSCISDTFISSLQLSFLQIYCPLSCPPWFLQKQRTEASYDMWDQFVHTEEFAKLIVQILSVSMLHA